MGTQEGLDPRLREKDVEDMSMDEKLSMLIGQFLYNLSTPEVRRHVLYQASLLEGLGAFERRKKDPTYEPLKDKTVTDLLLGKVKPLAVSFVPDGIHLRTYRDDGRY